MARYHKSKSGGVNHKSDHFNDEFKHEKDHGTRGLYGHHASSMIHEDHRAIANLPQEVMIKSYGMPGSYMREELNDDISGVDAQMRYDNYKRNEHFYPKKV